MKLISKKSFVFVVAGLAYLAGQYFRGAWLLNFTWPFECHRVNFGDLSYCDPTYLDSVGFPLIVFGEYLGVIGLILFFADSATFKKWLWLSLFYLPIAFGLILWMYPIHTPLGGEATYSDGVRMFGNLYLVITTGLVLWGFWKARRRK